MGMTAIVFDKSRNQFLDPFCHPHTFSEFHSILIWNKQSTAGVKMPISIKSKGPF